MPGRYLASLLLSFAISTTQALATGALPTPRDGVYVEEGEPCGSQWTAATSLFSDGKTIWASTVQCKVQSRELAHSMQILKESCTYLDGSDTISATILIVDPDHIQASFIDEKDLKKYRFCPGLAR